MEFVIVEIGMLLALAILILILIFTSINLSNQLHEIVARLGEVKHELAKFKKN